MAPFGSLNVSRTSNPGDAVALHAVAKKLLDEGFLLVRDAVDLYTNVEISFLEELQGSHPLTHANIFVPTTVRQAR
jgi:hypothetical protein